MSADLWKLPASSCKQEEEHRRRQDAAAAAVLLLHSRASYFGAVVPSIGILAFSVKRTA